MLAEQSGLCALCGEPPRAGRRFDVDHDHVTRHPRGLVHYHCNRHIALYENGRYNWPRRLSGQFVSYLGKTAAPKRSEREEEYP